MSAPPEILKLVERFREQHDTYVSGDYNETQLRRDFLDPFLRALGWDVDNQQGSAEQYREVVHEDKVLVGGESKAPDYSCRIGGVRKFFIEAKKPGVDLKNDPKPAFQLRRYGWSAKLPVSLLTNFEEFAVYDTRLRPSEKDKAASARVLYLTYREFADRWDEIADTFSKEAVLKGSFDKYVDGKKGRRGTATVDDAFLDEIEGWRELLAKDLARENVKVEVEDLNFAVQRILDRIIFLRICEDRRIEDYGQLGALVNGPHVYGRLKELFDKADRRYNSGLFHFREEKDRQESPDTVTPALKVGDKTLKEIINGLYYPAPWVFDVIPADILGHIYEQFLGKTIRLTAGHNVKVEEKPEVRKAGGVYYTPTYIVDYIVKETVGNLLEGKTPKEAAEIKILDPACGSGSFLIGAYQHLLDWHRAWYVKDGPEKYKKELYQSAASDWRLTTKTRKQILLNSIYGVDIDPQAVEVTKLSLLLKVMENAADQGGQFGLGLGERVLPDLGGNIKCGNSIISARMVLDAGGLFASEGGHVIRPFEWEDGFPAIFARRRPGFDAVIGNPPYSLIEHEDAKHIIASSYEVAEGRIDTFEVFMERGVRLLADHGMLGFIVPSPSLTNVYARKLRAFLLRRTQITAIANMAMAVFADPTVHTCVVAVQRTDSPTPQGTLRVWKAVDQPGRLLGSADYSISQQNLPRGKNQSFDVFIDPQADAVVKALEVGSVPLGDLCFIRQTIKTGNDKLYVQTSGVPLPGPWKRALRGASIERFVVREHDLYLKYGPWLARNWQNSTFFEVEKIVIRETGRRLVAAIDRDHRYLLSSLYSVYPKPSAGPIDLRLVLGILNSSLATYYLRLVALGVTEGAFTKFRTNQLARLPIRRPSPSGPSAASGERIIVLVERMLKLMAAGGKASHGAAALLDRDLDDAVCDFYELPVHMRGSIASVMSGAESDAESAVSK